MLQFKNQYQQKRHENCPATNRSCTGKQAISNGTTFGKGRQHRDQCEQYLTITLQLQMTHPWLQVKLREPPSLPSGACSLCQRHFMQIRRHQGYPRCKSG